MLHLKDEKEESAVPGRPLGESVRRTSARNAPSIGAALMPAPRQKKGPQVTFGPFLTIPSSTLVASLR
jgi:hypothetical protein